LLRGPGRVVAIGLAGLVILATSGRLARYRALNDGPFENPRPLVAEWAAAQSTAPVYVAARGVPGWTFYSTDWARPDTARLDWYVRENGLRGRAFRNAASVGHPVAGGDDLVWQTPSRLELLGSPSGMQITLAGMSQPRPDSGWAANEARRIRAAAHPDIWLFFSHQLAGEHRLVLDAVVALGAEKLLEREAPGAALYHVRFGDR
jgi:hypothetical protein